MWLARSTTSADSRGWVRLLFVASLVLGILAMHHVLVGHLDEAASSHSGMEMSAASHSEMSASIASHGEGHGDTGGSGGDGMSDCGGLMLLCVAVIAGIGAIFALRRLRSERVLWQLPPPSAIARALRIPAFVTLTPLERSCVLRC